MTRRPTASTPMPDPTTPSDDRWLTYAEAMQRVNASRSFVHRIACSGEVSVLRSGGLVRISEQSLESWISSRTNVA
jgi:excisionase family DNA binding protein